jgi:hypothetical protein
MADLGGCALTHRQQSRAPSDRSAIEFANENAVADATAQIATAAPFRGKISDSAHQQAVEERSREIRGNRRAKEKQRKFFIGTVSSRPPRMGRENRKRRSASAAIRPSRLSGALFIPCPLDQGRML